MSEVLHTGQLCHTTHVNAERQCKHNSLSEVMTQWDAVIRTCVVQHVYNNVNTEPMQPKTLK